VQGVELSRRAGEDVSEVLGCYSLRVYESPSNLQSGDSSELAPGLPCKGKSLRNRGVSQIMLFLVIPRSLLRGGFILLGQIPRSLLRLFPGCYCRLHERLST
jgi:hypothetical protein